MGIEGVRIKKKSIYNENEDICKLYPMHGIDCMYSSRQIFHLAMYIVHGMHKQLFASVVICEIITRRL